MKKTFREFLTESVDLFIQDPSLMLQGTLTINGDDEVTQTGVNLFGHPVFFRSWSDPTPEDDKYDLVEDIN